LMVGVWLLIGGAIGAFNGLLLTLSVHHMRPNAVQQSIVLIVTTGVVRWLATVLVIVGALRTSPSAGLLAAGGLWLAYRGIAHLAGKARLALWGIAGD